MYMKALLMKEKNDYFLSEEDYVSRTYDEGNYEDYGKFVIRNQLYLG